MPREMMFRALKVLSVQNNFELLCEVLDKTINIYAITPLIHKELSEAGLIRCRTNLETMEPIYGVTLFGQRLIDGILKADDGE